MRLKFLHIKPCWIFFYRIQSYPAMKAFIIAILAVAAVSQGSAQGLTALPDEAVQFPPPNFSKWAGFPPTQNQQLPTVNFQDDDGNTPVLQSLGPQLSQSLQSITGQLPALSNPSSLIPDLDRFPPTQNAQDWLNFQNNPGFNPVLQSLGPQVSQNLQSVAPQLAALSNPSVNFPDVGANLQNWGSQFPQSLQGIAPQLAASPNQPFPSGAFNPAMIQNLQSGFQNLPQGLTGLGRPVNFGQPGTPFPISAAENARNIETAMKTPAFKNFIDGLMKRPDVVGWRQAF